MVREHPLSGTELKRILAAAERGSLRDFCLLTIAANHAVRASELAGSVIRKSSLGKIEKVWTGIRVEDVYLADSRIRINRLKGSISEVERMSPAVQKIVASWIAAKPSSPWLFPGRDPSRPLTRGEIYNIFRYYAEMAQVPAVSRSPHAHRHTLAMRHVRAGVPISVLQRVMGHKSIHSTGQYFQHSQSEVDAARLKALA